MKKSFLILILLRFMFSTLFAEITEVKLDSIERCLERNNLTKKGYTKNSIGLRSIEFHSDYEVYMIKKYSRDRYSLIWGNLILQNNNAYLMPYDFNDLIYNGNDEINEKNLFNMVEKFIKLSMLVEVSVDRIEYKDVAALGNTIEDFDENPYCGYNIEAICSNKELGLKVKWNISYSEGKIIRVSFFNLGETLFKIMKNKYYIPTVDYPLSEMLHVDIE